MVSSPQAMLMLSAQIILPPRSNRANTTESSLSFTNANMSRSLPVTDMACCFSARLFMAFILSRSWAAFSYSIFSEADCICSVSSSIMGPVCPSRNLLTLSSSLWYSSRLTLPLHGAQHLPRWYMRQGRSLRAMALWISFLQCLTGNISRIAVSASFRLRLER